MCRICDSEGCVWCDPNYNHDPANDCPQCNDPDCMKDEQCPNYKPSESFESKLQRLVIGMNDARGLIDGR